ncbi:MAG: DUF805 domain-containing protein [Bacteroidales bacterium]|nr:DUF805 domain-containing protein [Bacteroidales bacterium]
MEEYISNFKKVVLENYVNFNGRARRKEFWQFILVNFVISIVVSIIAGMIGQWLSYLYSLALLLPGLSVGARRLHDINKSGWLQLLGIIPLIGIILLIYWWAQPGDKGDNPKGPDPKALEA